MITNNEPVSEHRIEFIDTEGIPNQPIPEALKAGTIRELQQEFNRKIRKLHKVYMAVATVATILNGLLFYNLNNVNQKQSNAQIQELKGKLSSEQARSKKLEQDLQKQSEAKKREKYIHSVIQEDYNRLYLNVLNCETISNDPKRCYGRMFGAPLKGSATRNPKRRKMANY